MHTVAFKPGALNRPQCLKEKGNVTKTNQH